MRDAGATVLRNEHALIGGIQFGGLARSRPRRARSRRSTARVPRSCSATTPMIQVRFNVRPEITLFTLERG